MSISDYLPFLVKPAPPKFVSERGNPVHGIMAEFETTPAVYHAAEKVRDAGYTKWDVYSPFPIHGIEDAMGEPCLTVFVPSSPTPFTGYVITVPRKDTIDLGISIEDALKFAVSGGVLVPPSQTINRSSTGTLPYKETNNEDA